MKNKKCAVLGIFAFVVAVFLVFGSNAQSRSKPCPQMQLGGGFIGSGGGLTYDAVQIPLDPAGRKAALHLKVHAYSPAFAPLLAAFGADSLTEATGEVEMTGRDTFELSWIAYAVKQGNPPIIGGIMVLTGTAQFTDPDTYVLTSIFKVYAAAADADNDGFPDPGTLPSYVSSSSSVTAKRVPIP